MSTSTSSLPLAGNRANNSATTAWVLTVLAVLAWALFQVAEPTKAHSSEPFRWSLWVRHFADVAEVWRTRPLWRATMGICFFYGVGGYATVLLQQVGYELTHGGPGAGLASSQLLLMVGVGTMLGNLLAGLLSRRGVELGLAPIGGAMLTPTSLALTLAAFYLTERLCASS